MPDDTNSAQNQDTQNQTPPTPIGETPSQGQTPPPIPPVSDMGDINPPTPEENEETMGAGLPPVIAASDSGGAKPRGKMIATILGILLLVFGVGAGVILVQRNQELREKASCVETDSTCYFPSTGLLNCCDPNAECVYGELGQYSCVTQSSGGGGGGGGVGDECSATKPCKEGLWCPGLSGYGDTSKCETKPGNCPNTDCNIDSSTPGAISCTLTNGQQSYCCPTSNPTYNAATKKCESLSGDGGPTPTPTPSGGGGGGGGQCTQKPEIWGDYSRFPIDPADCEYAADGETFRTCYEKYKVAGCQTAPANPQDDLGCAKVGRRLATRYGYPSYECGATAKELATINCTNALGVFERWCLGGGGGAPSAQCREIKAYDTSWTLLSATDLASLEAGDVVRFSVSGTTTSGTITKARFIINGITRPEVTQKKPDSNEFYDEYTLPEGRVQFTINAQLFHSQAGWF